MIAHLNELNARMDALISSLNQLNAARDEIAAKSNKVVAEEEPRGSAAQAPALE